MKQFSIIIISCFCYSVATAQGEVQLPVNDNQLVKGFYKTYQEFLSNSPSVRVDFSTELTRLGKDDSTIIAGRYIMPDSLDNFGETWGFCDGIHIFIANGTPFVLRYWKLQCNGPNPYFYYSERQLTLMPTIAGILSTVLSASLPPSLKLMVVNKSGRPDYSSRYNLKRIFRDSPAIAKEFKGEGDLTDSLVIKYLVRYNGSKLK